LDQARRNPPRRIAHEDSGDRLPTQGQAIGWQWVILIVTVRAECLLPAFKPNTILANMDWRRIREAFARADEARTGIHMSRAEARRVREGWRAWRAEWARIEEEPAAERMLTVCMYCERFHITTGEWLAIPVGLAGMLHDPKLVQLTHGVCPICLAGRLGEV